jgi:predicted DNA-binding transcriptional regulator AlpA
MTRSAEATDLNQHRIIDRREAAAILGVGLSTLDKMRENNVDFPKPIRLGERRLGWPASALAAWLARESQQSAKATAA